MPVCDRCGLMAATCEMRRRRGSKAGGFLCKDTPVCVRRRGVVWQAARANRRTIEEELEARR